MATAIITPRQLVTTIVVAASDSLEPWRASWDDTLGRYLQCDGTNDEVEIMAAIAALPADGGEVVLLEGTFNIASSIAITRSNFTLRGMGRPTIIYGTAAALDIITATGGSGTELTHIILRDFLVRGIKGTTDMGISWVYVDNSKIINVWSELNGEENIRLENCDNDELESVSCIDSTTTGIRLTTCTWIKISNSITNFNDSEGIAINESTDCQFDNVTSYDNTAQGMRAYDNCDRMTITGGHFSSNGAHGIYFQRGVNYACVVGAECNSNALDGIEINASAAHHSDHNLIDGCLCTGNTGAGIQLLEAGGGQCNWTMIGKNKLQGNTGGCIIDGGTNTQLPTYVVPFSDGSDPQDSGWLIDLAGEYARGWLRLPFEVKQVVRMNVYARSVVAETHEMELEMVVYGGADNQPYTTHNGSIAQLDSVSVNFAADDVIFWRNTEAGTLALVGGDSVEVKVLHEAAEGDNCATDAFFRTVEIEYV